VASLLLLSWDLWFMGYPDQSLSRVSEALALAQDLGQPYMVAFAHYMTSVVHLLRGDAARALESAERSFEMSQEQRFSLYTSRPQVQAVQSTLPICGGSSPPTPGQKTELIGSLCPLITLSSRRASTSRATSHARPTKSRLCHPLSGARSHACWAHYFAGAPSLTGVSSAVLSPCLLASFRSRSCFTRVEMTAIRRCRGRGRQIDIAGL